MTRPDITAVPTLAGRELDVLIAEYVFGMDDVMYHADSGIAYIKYHADDIPHYSRDRDRDPSLFDLLERVRADRRGVIVGSRNGRHWAIFDRPVTTRLEGGLSCVTIRQEHADAPRC